MEIALKTGEELECNYTGSAVGVLVRLQGSSPDAPQTGWLSRKALEDALRVISSLDGGGAPVVHAVAAGTPVASARPQQAPVPTRTPVAPVNVEVVQNLVREVQKLVSAAEREEPDEGKKKGVKEQDVRELMQKFKPLFPGPSGAQQAFRVFNGTIGMARERFDLIWNFKVERLAVDHMPAEED